jgi:hypothetical protein
MGSDGIAGTTAPEPSTISKISISFTVKLVEAVNG